MEHNFEANFFALLQFLDPASRYEVEAACTRISIPAQQMIYRQDDPANTLYIVSSGVVEALTHSPDGQQTRCIGYMRRGDFFGDLALLTGHPRFGSVRACEDSELLWIEKAAFLNLLDKIPKMGAYFTRNLARRLHKTSTEAHLDIYALDLTGNLRQFDLPTVFQAITGMRQTGELHLNNADNELIGSFFFTEGRPDYARFMHLDGIEAIWEGFVQSAMESTFTFQVMAHPVLPFTEEHHIRFDGDLIAQGLAYRDTFLAMPEPLRRMEGSLSRLTESLSLPVTENQELAGKIWALLGSRPQPLNSLWRRLNCSSLAFLGAVHQLASAGQATWSPEHAPEEKPS